MLSARFFHCWRAIFTFHSHLIFFAPWGIYTHFVTLPPVFTGQLHSIQWKPRTPWGKFLLALWFFLQFLTTTFLYFMRTQYAIEISVLLPYRWLLGIPLSYTAERSWMLQRSLTHVSSSVTVIGVLPLGMQWNLVRNLVGRWFQTDSVTWILWDSNPLHKSTHGYWYSPGFLSMLGLSL